jgi:hypothetical protein
VILWDILVAVVAIVLLEWTVLTLRLGRNFMACPVEVTILITDSHE